MTKLPDGRVTHRLAGKSATRPGAPGDALVRSREPSADVRGPPIAGTSAVRARRPLTCRCVLVRPRDDRAAKPSAMAVVHPLAASHTRGRGTRDRMIVRIRAARPLWALERTARGRGQACAPTTDR